MPIPGGGRYRIVTTKSGKHVRLHFTPGGSVNEAKGMESGSVHTPAEFAADKKKSKGETDYKDFRKRMKAKD